LQGKQLSISDTRALTSTLTRKCRTPFSGAALLMELIRFAQASLTATAIEEKYLRENMER
jgi:hypothetical protein